MPAALEKLDDRIDKKTRELGKDRTKTAKVREVVRRKEDRVELVEEALDDAQDILTHKKRIRRDLEDGFRHGNEETGKPWDSIKVDRRREILADEIEDAAGDRDRLLDRLDELASKSERAKERLKKWLDRTETDAERLEHLRKKRAAVRDRIGELNEDFVIMEFACHNGEQVPDASIPALAEWCDKIGSPAKRHFNAAFHVNSAFRSLGYNASIGGASLSIHVYNGSWQHSPWAVAVDGYLDGVAHSTLQAWLNPQAYVSGMGYYSSFTHSDNRARIGWERSRWNGP